MIVLQSHVFLRAMMERQNNRRPSHALPGCIFGRSHQDRQTLQKAGFSCSVRNAVGRAVRAEPREEKTHARCNTLLRISHADAMDYPDHACRIFNRRLRLTGSVGCYFSIGCDGP